MIDFRHEDGTKCDAGFHCPSCGGHRFGTDSQHEGAWVVHCHECSWYGPYDKHVSSD